MSSEPWPRVGFEEQTWAPTAQFGVGAGRRQLRTTYPAAVPPLISSLRPQPTAETAALAGEATLELARLDAEIGASFAGYGPVLLRSEAASSSQIEHLTASARSVLSAEAGIKTGQNAQMIASNTRAMQAALGLAGDLSAESIRAMHRALMEEQPRHTPGEFRTEAVWIGSRSDSPVGADFVAPHHSRVATLVDDLTAFARQAEAPSLVTTAVAHAQFETVHPFSDGNGRTGRAFAQAMLRNRGVLRSVAVPVSAGLLADVRGYHRALQAYRDGHIDPIVNVLAQASLRAVWNSRTLVSELDNVRASWASRLKARPNSNAWRLLGVVVRRPVLSAKTAAEELGTSPSNVYGPLKALVDSGILKSKQEHRMGPFWRADEVLDALDRFAERAGRRELPPATA